MRTRTKVLIGAAAAVVVLGGTAAVVGPNLYADAANKSAEAAPSLAPTGDATLPASEADGTWTAGDGSYAGYRVDEVLRGQDVTVVGRTESVDGTIEVADGSLRSGKVTVQVADITTPESARDAYFRDSALETERFPTAVFEITEPVDVSDALAGGDRDVQLQGELTMHGETKQVTADAQIGVDADGEVQVAGSIPVTFADYGVQAPDLGFVSVDPDGEVEFSLDLAK